MTAIPGKDFGAGGRAVSRVLWWAVAAVVGGAFVVAGVLKLRDPVAFSDSVAGFGVLPDLLVGPVALVLPWVEIVWGGLLMIGWRRRAMAAGVFGMTVVFMVVLGQAAVRGLEVDCGCFGAGGTVAGSLARDAVLAVLAGGVWWREVRGGRVQRGRRLVPAGVSGADRREEDAI